MLLKALREHAPTHVALVFDAGRKSFRQDLDPVYKANRPEAPDDLARQFPLVREVAKVLNVPVLEEPGVEADDVIGTLACRARAQGWEVVIVTGDKDFAQLVDGQVSLLRPHGRGERPGRLDRRRPRSRRRWASRPAQVVEYQTILGDKIDNVPGIPGVGEVDCRRARPQVRLGGGDAAPPGRRSQRGSTRGREAEGEDRRERRAAAAQPKAGRAALRHAAAYEPAAFERRAIDAERTRALFGELEFSRLLKDLPAPPPSAREVHTELLLDRPRSRRRWRSRARRGRWGCAPRSAGETRAPIRSSASRSRPVGAPSTCRSSTGTSARPRQLSEEVAREALRPLVEDPAIAKHGHDLKAEAHVLAPARARAGRRGRRHRDREPPAPPHPARARPRRRGAGAALVPAAGARARHRQEVDPHAALGAHRGADGRGRRPVRGGAAGSRQRPAARDGRRGADAALRGGGAPARAAPRAHGAARDPGRHGRDGVDERGVRPRHARPRAAHPRGGRPPVQHRLHPRARAGAVRGAEAAGAEAPQDRAVHRPGRAGEAGRAAPAAGAGAGAPLARRS